MWRTGIHNGLSHQTSQKSVPLPGKVARIDPTSAQPAHTNLKQWLSLIVVGGKVGFRREFLAIVQLSFDSVVNYHLEQESKPHCQSF